SLSWIKQRFIAVAGKRQDELSQLAQLVERNANILSAFPLQHCKGRWLTTCPLYSYPLPKTVSSQPRLTTNIFPRPEKCARVHKVLLTNNHVLAVPSAPRWRSPVWAVPTFSLSALKAPGCTPSSATSVRCFARAKLQPMPCPLQPRAKNTPGSARTAL